MVTDEQRLEAEQKRIALEFALQYPVTAGNAGTNAEVKDRATAFYKFLKPTTIPDTQPSV